MGIVGKKTYRVDDEASFTYDVFASLKFGDVILAKRYNTEIERQKIEEGHEVGPYVVLGRSEEGNLLCFQSSSGFPKSFIGKLSVFPLKFSDANLTIGINKDTYIRTIGVLEINRGKFLKKICSLDDFLIKKLKKRIALNREMGIIKNDEQVKKYNIPIEAGDIIEKLNGWYLILYFNENKKAVCLPLLRNETGEIITIGGRDYNIDFNIIVTLDSIKKAKRIGFTDSATQLPALLAKMEKYLKYKEEFYTIKRGSLVEYNGLLYYVYGEEGNAWLAYQVWSENTESKLEKIVINQNFYYSDFEIIIQIDKGSTTAEALALASEKETEYNKKVKKYYLEQKHKKKSRKSVSSKSSKAGTYVKRFRSGK